MDKHTRRHLHNIVEGYSSYHSDEPSDELEVAYDSFGGAGGHVITFWVSAPILQKHPDFEKKLRAALKKDGYVSMRGAKLDGERFKAREAPSEKTWFKLVDKFTTKNKYGFTKTGDDDN